MDLLSELSVDQLSRSTETAFPATTLRQHATDMVAVVDMQLVPAKNSLLAKAVVRGSTGRKYDCMINFKKVKYNPVDSASVTFVAGDQEYTIAPIEKNVGDVKVRCNCLDFRFRFAHYDHSNQALHGRQPPLYAKVPGSRRGPVNPLHSPGFCKHIIDFIDSLEDSGLFG